MERLLIDNWCIQNIVINMFDKTNEISKEYTDLLSAIVLWDEIFYPQNEFTNSWKRSCFNNMPFKIFIPYNDEEKLFEKESNNLYINYYKDFEESVVASGAIRYLLLSDWLGCDYMPSNERAKFISKYNPVENGGIELLRTEYTNFLDNSILECFKELNSIIGKNVFEINMPVLTDFIIQNTPDNLSYIEFATMIREEKTVIKFRKFLSKMEDELNNCNWKKIFEFKKESEELVHDIIKIDKENIVNVSGSWSITPSINISKDVKFKKKNTHLTFLKELTEYAFCGRRMKKM